MGYSITIGESAIDIDIDSENNYSYVYALDTKHDTAPADEVPTDRTNSRWSSYSGWQDFTKAVDLEDRFWNKHDGLMRDHPGYAPITEAVKNEISKANVRVQKDSNIDQNNKTRMKWLEYWTTWAFENCNKPIMDNG